MPTVTFEYRTEGERAAIERAVAFVAEMNDLAHSAPAGSVLDHCEAQALDGGRELLRETLRLAVQDRATQAEGKKGRPATARAAAGSASGGSASAR